MLISMRESVQQVSVLIPSSLAIRIGHTTLYFSAQNASIYVYYNYFDNMSMYLFLCMRLFAVMQYAGSVAPIQLEHLHNITKRSTAR